MRQSFVRARYVLSHFDIQPKQTQTNGFLPPQGAGAGI